MKRSKKITTFIIIFFLVIALVIIGRYAVGLYFKKKFSKRPPPGVIVEVISKCAGTSWMFENRASHVVDGDYTPHSSINIWLKDLGIVLDVAKENQFSAPLAAAALQQFVAAAGHGCASVIAARAW